MDQEKKTVPEQLGEIAHGFAKIVDQMVKDKEKRDQDHKAH